MIPLHLYLSGFLSYREPAELDFTVFELACIAGPNGAGKSSLLDAITWALFGQARKHDDSLINAQSTRAVVSLIFAYEGNIYRVQRSKTKDKTAMLEFQILQNSEEFSVLANQLLVYNGRRSVSADLHSPLSELQSTGSWKPLGGGSLRETERLIRETLRLDYETFVNASFFLQGKADQFTQQAPNDRKRILGSILGLDVWEVYRKRAAERRKAVLVDIARVDVELGMIHAELAEEEPRRERLKELQGELGRLSRARASQEKILEAAVKVAAAIVEQGKTVDSMARRLAEKTQQLNENEALLSARREESNSFSAILGRAGQIEAAFAAWQQARADLERWEEVAGRFREQEKRRQEPLLEISAAQARLVQEQQNLLAAQATATGQRATLPSLEAQIAELDRQQSEAEARLEQRKVLESALDEARSQLAAARAENPRLKSEMDELKERIEQLLHVEGALCPLCGQPLSPDDRQRLIDELNVQGKDMGARFRANQTVLRAADQRTGELGTQIAELTKAEIELRQTHATLAQHNTRLETTRQTIAEWEDYGAPRLAEIALSLEQESYAPEARARLAQIDDELKAIGYAAAEHDLARRAEQQGRATEAELRALASARAALAPLEREIAGLQEQIGKQQAEVAREQQEHQAAVAALADIQAQAPDLEAAERALGELVEQENGLRLEVGAAQQKVSVLEGLKARCAALEADRAELAWRSGRYEKLELAFSNKGVPALLIEQALPQIESKANEILDRLSQGSMSVRFATQRAFKDKQREDQIETLDILISDGAGMRDYELFSGGEGFRVNFAIRLALSEVLAQRAGARLQTLVIDEGFGSQDALGRQRLLEAISLVRQDFAKVLVISHLDELKDAFPNRVEVEKTAKGSVVRVI